ncbi:caspase family protein [Bremerella sp. P1]|uniref:caspase family protein n=1 Tax=Bremerella sp. P1 TaxID=3026424 RepID=UPI0023679BD3|nr:caspase family protein [Bremerella sp. P1]WDI42602.1 caspase family protein [Bremerella sp. P1]
MKFALIIAVEEYADSRMQRVRFAESDAGAFSAVLEKHGFDAADRVTLINDQATHQSIQSRLQRTVKSLLEDDQLYVYFSGYGFSKKGANYLTCYDTDPDDLANTSIKLSWMFEQFEESDCRKIVLLLDSSESGMLDTQDLRYNYAAFKDAKLKAFFNSSSHCVCFAACKSGQTSHTSPALRHGIWAHHLVEALGGKAPAALVNNTQLTSASLQKYLKRCVPQTLSTLFTTKKDQTPWFAGNGELPLVDMTELFDQRSEAASQSNGQVKNVTLLARRTMRVQDLAGFQRGKHSKPARADSLAEKFIAKIAQEEIDADINHVFQSLRQQFKFKRADMNVSNQGDGTATIITPYFNYSITVHLAAEDPSKVIWLRMVDAIKEPEKLFSDRFAAIFADVFDTVTFEPAEPIDLPQLIDRLEDLEDDRLIVDYDPGVTFCSLSIDGIDGQITVTSDLWSIVHEKANTPKSLLAALFTIEEKFVDQHDVRLISFLDTPAG